MKVAVDALVSAVPAAVALYTLYHHHETKTTNASANEGRPGKTVEGMRDS